MSKAKLIEFLAAGLMDANGNPLAGYQGRAFAADGTTPKVVWQDRDKTLPTVSGTASFTMSSAGQAILYGDGIYTFKLWTAAADPDTDNPYLTFSGVDVLSAVSLEAALDDFGTDSAAAIVAFEAEADAKIATFNTGAIVQEVVVTRTTAETTTSTTLVDTGLTGAITPIYNNSIIMAEAWLPTASVWSGNNITISRRALLGLRIVGGAEGPTTRFGHDLVAASSAYADTHGGARAFMRHQVSSLNEITFVLQWCAFATGMAPVVTSSPTSHSAYPYYLILWEIKQ
jgi:hypothetical protein